MILLEDTFDVDFGSTRPEEAISAAAVRAEREGRAVRTVEMERNEFRIMVRRLLPPKQLAMMDIRALEQPLAIFTPAGSLKVFPKAFQKPGTARIILAPRLPPADPYRTPGRELSDQERAELARPVCPICGADGKLRGLVAMINLLYGPRD